MPLCYILFHQVKTNKYNERFQDVAAVMFAKKFNAVFYPEDSASRSCSGTGGGGASGGGGHDSSRANVFS